MFAINNLSTGGGVALALPIRRLCKPGRFSTLFTEPQKAASAHGEANRGELSTFEHSLLLLLVILINRRERRRMFTVKETAGFDI